MKSSRSLLRDAAVAYVHSMQRYEQGFGTDAGDDALDEMMTMERCLNVTENSTEWRSHPSLVGARR